VVTIVLLSIVFLSIASWNVGATQFPVSNWQSTQTETFQVYFSQNQQVQNVYFWVKSGNATVTIYAGSPEKWNFETTRSLRPGDVDYAKVESSSFSANAQFLKFVIQPANYDSRPMFWNWGITNPSDQKPSPFVEISEIAVTDSNNQQIPLIGITGENTSDITLTKLVDEQNSVTLPPTYMTETYFDEVYFVKAADNYLNHQLPYERTHPPLGKLIQAAGIAIFGDTPFGWREMGVIFATLMVPLIYLLGKKLFGTWIGGFSAAFLLTFDFMHFTMARMGTVDTYVIFFSLASQLFFLIYLKNVLKVGWKTSILPLFIAVMFFTLSFSTKWIGLYCFLAELAVLAMLRIRELKNVKNDLYTKFLSFFDYPYFYIVGFVGVAVIIYFLTYIPDMLAGDSLPTIFNLQLSMFSFHAGSTATHPYSSPWYSWPLLFDPINKWVPYAMSKFPNNVHVPLFLSLNSLPNGMYSKIVLLGNPAVWWVGFTAVIGLTCVYLTRAGFIISRILKILKAKISKTATQQPQNLPSELPTQKTRRYSFMNGARWFASKIDLPIFFVVTFFFIQLFPYILISRTTYIYHFYLNVPILILGSTYFINKMWKYKWGKMLTIIYFAVVVAMFVLFYPVISGAPASTSTIDSLKWFPSWSF
jgi:dolichyl-phosphate-mannose-protein mannosyltransferase